MVHKVHKHVLSTLCIAALAACGGGGGSGSTTALATPQSAQLKVLMSDASSEDWSVIGVKVLSIALAPQGGASAVTVYTAPTPAPTVNLAQLDQLGELLGNATIPAGTYTGATLTISANPGDVLLTTSADPEAGFAAAAGTAIPPAQIQIQGAQGTAGSMTTSVALSFVAPLAVSASTTNALNLEVDLSHPAFIVGHVPPGLGTTQWAVNFNGPIRQHKTDHITDLVLRHSYGSVSSVATNNTSITIAKDLPAFPIQTPETAVASGQSLTILADATNGSLFYDLDAKTSATIKDFSSVASSLTGKYVRVAARYQQDGSLVATRIWAGTLFNTVWFSPEGHVVHVNAPSNRFVVTDESGHPMAISVDANTKFFFRTPSSPLADATPIGTGTSFVSSGNLMRGFKVHVQAVDPLATPLVASTVDIETAAFAGKISAASTSNFTYTRKFATLGDNYSATLPYIAASSANGQDAGGNPISGFKYWNFAYPTVVTSGTAAVSSFVSATSGSANFGGTVGSIPAHGASFARWGDTANPTGWSAPWTVLVPAPVPLGTVAAAYANNAFQLNVAGGAQSVAVAVSTSPGSATLVYQVDRTNGVVTVSPQDITTAAGLAAMTHGLMVGAKVKVDAVPQTDGSLRTQVLTYFTGDQPR